MPQTPYRSGIVMAAKVYNRTTKKTIPLWYPESGIILTSISVSMKQGGNSEIEVEVQMPYDTGIGIMGDPDSIFNISNVLMVQFGWAADGFLSPWYAGVMNAPSVTIAETITANLSASGAGAMALARAGTKTWSGTRKSIVEEIAALFRWKVVYSQTNFDIGTYGWTGSRYFEEPVEIAQAGETFFMFLAGILHVSGLSFWIGTDTDGKAALFIRPKGSALNEIPTRSFIKWGQVDPYKNQFPLLSFQTSDNPFVATGDAGFSHAWMDESGNIVEYEGTEENNTSPRLGTGTAVGGKTDDQHAETGLMTDMKIDKNAGMTAGTQGAPPTGAKEDQETVQALHNAKLTGENHASTIETIGIPNILPGELVYVYGCSARFDGNYRVQEVKHTVGDGFSTSLECIRDAYPAGFGFGDVLQENKSKGAV